MKSRIILIIMIATIWSVASARQISGIVVSEKDSLPVANAKCLLLSDGKEVQHTSSDANGRFELITSLKGDLLLTLTKDDFNPTDVIIDSTKDKLDLGIIWLSSATVLDELTVEGRVDIDAKGRTIVYPSAADVRASHSSLSLFQKLPLDGLSADPINRSLSVMGSTPAILIDDVPSSLSDLMLINPKNIAKIEYSILPPVRYAVKGTKGFISITLKKRTDGGSVNIWARSALTTCFADANALGSYHQGPSKFQISLSPSWRNYGKVFDHQEESYIGTDGFRLDLTSDSRSPFNYFNLPAQLKYTFVPKQSTIFSAALNLNSFSDHRRSAGTTHDFLNDDYDFNNESRSKDLSTSLDLYFRHDFNARNSLEAEMVGTLSNNKYNRENIYDYLSGRTERYPVDIHSDRRSLITEVTYSHNFSDYSELSAGASNTLSHSRNKYLTTDYQPSLTENNNYVYASYAHLIDRVYLMGRTGLQLNWLRNDGDHRHYIRNISSLQMQWTPAQAFSLTASANYSSGIPGLTALTDYAQKVTPYLISNGNPDLKSSHSIYATIRPRVRYKKFTLMASAGYQTVLNGVFNDVTYLGDGMFLSQSVNSRRAEIWSAQVQLQVSDLKGFGCNVTVGYNHYSSAGGSWSQSLASWDGVIYLWYNIRKFTISYWYKFPGKSLWGQSVSKGENGDALQVAFRPNKNWSIEASWMHMFDGHGTKYPSWKYSAVNPSYVNRNIRNNGNMICLSVNYSADFGSIFRTKDRSLNNSDRGSAILKL